MRTRPLPRIALACLLLALGACQSSSKAQWSEAEFAAGSRRLLEQVGAVALEKAGFPGGIQSDGGELMVSGWDVSLAPFKGDGFRERATLRAEPAAEEGRWKVAVRVERERNDNMVSPLDLAHAKWKSEPDDEERAKLVLQFMRSLLGSTLEVSPAKRRRTPGT